MEIYRARSFKDRRYLRSNKKKRNSLIWIIPLVLIAGFLFFKNNYAKNKEPMINETVSAVEGASFQSETVSSPSSSPDAVFGSLKEAIENSLNGTEGTYGVVVKNLKTGESYSFNSERSFEAGSLYKLWVMGTVFKKMESGEIEGDEELSRSISDLNQIFNMDPELAEQTQGTITLSVDEALNQMITISHNYAALLLTERVKLSSVASYLDANGFNNSKVGTDGSAPITTPSDVALFMEKLYKGELGSADSTNKMISLLKNQQLNNKLPLNLPQGTVIAHKTGEIGSFSHDAGIVYTDHGNYIIVVMSESSMPAGAEDRIAQLSKTVFDYFQK